MSKALYKSIPYIDTKNPSDPDAYMYDVIMPKYDGVCIAVGKPRGVLEGFIRAGYPVTDSQHENVRAFNDWLQGQPWRDFLEEYIPDGYYVIGEWMNRQITIAYGVKETEMWQVHDYIHKSEGETIYPTLETANAFRKHLEAQSIPLIPRCYFGTPVDDITAAHYFYRWASEPQYPNPYLLSEDHEGFVRRRYGNQQEVDDGEQLSLQVIEKWVRPDFVPGLEFAKNPGMIRYNEIVG